METRKFILTSDKIKGEVVFEFTDSILTKYDTSSAELTDAQILFFATYLPRELYEVEAFLKRSETAKFTEIVQEITFEMFWNKYDEKIRSSKKETLKRWNKMSKNEQRKAYNYIQKYFYSIPQGVVKMYATTYLK